MLDLVEHMYLEGYHCGWSGSWGAEQALEHHMERLDIKPWGGGYQPRPAMSGPINPPPKAP